MKHSNKHEYLTNCQLGLSRDADYKTRDKLNQKFTAISRDFTLDGFSGNLAMYCRIYRKSKKVKFTKKYDWNSFYSIESVSLYQAMPSALALYRICASFPNVEVEASGPDGYKCIWMISLKHNDTNRIIGLGDSKGAFSFWTSDHGKELLDKAFMKDLKDLLEYLISDTCAHPYDSLVAGSVA